LIVAAADYPFLQIVGTIIVFFAWIAWFWAVITVLGDIFRRQDMSGWGKAAWVLFVVVVPFLGILIYLGGQGKHMAERNLEQAQAQRAQLDEYVRATAGTSAGGGAAAEIAQAKELLDKGAINQAEFDRLKQQAIG
jgi:Phospholipase_D-nuclease N-terminal/Short C-terminal domain